MTRDLAEPASPEAARRALSLAAAFGPSCAAVLHYGSRAHGAGVEPDSAWDFFVVLDRYADGYRALAAAGGGRPRPRLATLLARLLPPNVIAVEGPCGAGAATAKCAVLSRGDLARACSRHPRDHFTRARLFQPLQLAWARDDRAGAEVREAVRAARAGTFAWARTSLPARFGAEEYCATLFRVSYAAELRPEGSERPADLMAAQGPRLLPMYRTLLERLAARGELAREDDRFRDRHPPGALGRLAARSFFAVSKVRATLRWAKYVALYDGWLDYVVRKVERRRGVRIELSARERRWPLLFLWPRALRVLRRRPRRDR